ncbi:MAG TPA: NAD(P)H-dependent oxidoreductase [Phenylobacterium sp.]|nr:NAD(P)H-dependent oxidoreductase [Phenylobacterium sp.]
MKHAVIIAHPKADSLTATIGVTYAEALRGLGEETLVRDLYAMGFDPCLKASELPGAAGVQPAADIAAERALLADVQAFAFVYPFWFNAPPAILKGYVDRVFGLGFGYLPASGGTEPGLPGRQLISFTCSGAPEVWVHQTGALDALGQIFDGHVAAVCGLTVVDHRHFGGIVPGITTEAVADILDEVRATARRLYGPPE